MIGELVVLSLVVLPLLAIVAKLVLDERRRRTERRQTATDVSRDRGGEL